jgi:anti-anti-sigma factor
VDIEQRALDDVSVVQVTGNLDTNTAPDMQTCLDELVEAGATRIVVDFATLDYISSAGLRVLLVTAKRMRGAGGTLRLCGLNETVQEVFEISGFSTIFNLHGDEAAAISAF